MRNVNSRSFDSIWTLTLNRSLVTPGTGALGPPTRPPTTSVGLGTASASAFVVPSGLRPDSSLGMNRWTSGPLIPPGSLLKYGTP